MAKIQKLYKREGKDKKTLVYPATITQAVKDGETGQNLHEYMNDIKPKFKFDATQTDSQLGTVGTIQLSQDGGKIWNPISPEFLNYLRIQDYVATTSALPANKPVGTIYGVGPTYADDDTAHTNPIYRLHVWNGSSWVDNGQFTSIAAGVVQEIGDSETEVMSQKAVTDKLSELGGKVGVNRIEQNHVCSYSSEYVYEGYVQSTSYDTIWVYIQEGTSRILIENTISSPRFNYFDDFSTEVEHHISWNRNGIIPAEAKICLVALAKSEYPNGYSTLRINQIGGEFAKKMYVDDKIARSLKNYRIDRNHTCTPNSYEYSNIHHCIWVDVDKKDVNLIKVENTEAIRFQQFNSNEPTEESYIGSNATGYILSNAKLVIIVIPITEDEDLSSISVALYGRNSVLTAFRSFVTEYSHMISVDLGEGMYDYIHHDGFDCLWVNLLDNVASISVEGVTSSYIGYFKSYEITQENYLGSNNTGIVPKGAVLCLINIKKTEGLVSDYENVVVIQEQDFVKNERFDKLFSPFITQLPVGKNYINANDLLKGYVLDGGKVIPSVNGILSNKIYLEDGVYYTLQGIYYYGSYNAIYLVTYDKNGNQVGSIRIPATFAEGDTTHMGSATFQFNSGNGEVKYVRIVLQGNAKYPFDSTIAQLEKGTTLTPVEPYEGTDEIFEVDSSSKKQARKTVRLLSIGNSYSQDALAYVPYILDNMGVGLDVQIGILMQSSAPLSWHVDNFNNNDEVYSYYHNTGGAWQSLGLKSIQWALDSYEWDIVALQQSSQGAFAWETYQPYCSQLMNLVSGYVKYPVKFVWYQPMARPASVNSGANWSDDVILEHYVSTANASRRILEETILEAVVPVGTAIQNARTIPELKAMGSYAQNELNTSGLGYLTPNDGVHLQEGLPCQIAAYTFVLSILDLYGFKGSSINGETTRATEDWAIGKNIPAPHGSYIGSTDKYCLMAQKCVIMAVKHPYQVTDMTDIV